ncbi:LapA family protein, partial [Frankia tisae]|uniref:LapA family protein n=1 Tax=Frankia tisae TaxID=2950104 RepID=UPI0021C17EF2
IPAAQLPPDTPPPAAAYPVPPTPAATPYGQPPGPGGPAGTAPGQYPPPTTTAPRSPTSPTTDPGRRRRGLGRNGRAERTHIPVTRTSRVWTTLLLFALVLILLLIFILQNQDDVKLSYLGAHGSIPLAVAMLFSAIAGALLVAIPGVGRMIQLRKVARRGTAAAPAAPVTPATPVAPADGRVPSDPAAGKAAKMLHRPTR